MDLCYADGRAGAELPFLSRRAKLQLTRGELETLETLSRSPLTARGRALRASILLRYHGGGTVSSIARALGVSRPRVERCVTKALEMGVAQALAELPGRGRRSVITVDAQTWVSSLISGSPGDFGYPQALWTTRLLAYHIRDNCRVAGHPSLERLSPGTVSKILRTARRNLRATPNYRSRSVVVDLLYVHRKVEISLDASGPGNGADVSPEENGPPTKSSRGEPFYLLTGIDLETGELLHLARERRGAAEFIEFLKLADSHYPPGARVRLTLDDDRAYVSKEIRVFLKTSPNRFEFKFAPQQGRWLNLVESLFDKILASQIRELRPAALEDLRDRISRVFQEINAIVTVRHWIA